MLTGGAVLLGGAVLGSSGTAEAADGKSVLLGKANAATATTKVTTSGNNQALNVTNSSTGTQAHGVLAYTKNGYGLLGESTGNYGAVIRTHNKAKSALRVENLGGASVAPGITSVVGSTTSAATALSKAPFRAAGEFAGSFGVLGVRTAESSGGVPFPPTGVTGISDSSGGYNGNGVLAINYGNVGDALVALSANENGSAIYAVGNTALHGNLDVSGTISKGGGSFKIDHPHDPANKYLYHSFVESPDMMNVYNGVVIADSDGKATVELPDWFETLNRDFRYQLTPIGNSAPELHVSAEVAGDRFSIAGAKPRQKISWQLTGIRQDAWANDHRIPVEQTKPAAERGKYLYPEGFGKPRSAGMRASARERFGL